MSNYNILFPAIDMIDATIGRSDEERAMGRVEGRRREVFVLWQRLNGRAVVRVCNLAACDSRVEETARLCVMYVFGKLLAKWHFASPHLA